MRGLQVIRVYIKVTSLASGNTHLNSSLLLKTKEENQVNPHFFSIPLDLHVDLK